MVPSPGCESPRRHQHLQSKLGQMFQLPSGVDLGNKKLETDLTPFLDYHFFSPKKIEEIQIIKRYPILTHTHAPGVALWCSFHDDMGDLGVHVGKHEMYRKYAPLEINVFRGI